MKNKNLITIIWLLFCPFWMKADDRKPEANVNERYVVESIGFSGIEESRISKDLRDAAQKMVGEKYSEQSADAIAKGIGKELKKYDVEVKVERGEKPEHVKVLFQIEKKHEHPVNAEIPLVVYHSKEGFSGDIEIPFETHHNVFTLGMVSDADRLLERYTGYRFRYEHRKVGTNAVHLQMDFDTYHESFNAATRTALSERSDVPGIYRDRQNFAPSLSVYPTKSLSISAGLSFERLRFQFPALHTQTAYAGTADIEYRPKLEKLGEYRQDFSASYSLRTATRILDSDFVYTRQFVTADYTISNRRNLFGIHFAGGFLNGTPPLFERFSFGNSATLRGWNKFDVAPLGGTRAAQGSLEYRYRHIQVFYDVGTVWESKGFSEVRHGLGFGWASKHKFISLAFPVRLHDVAPVFMLGIRD